MNNLAFGVSALLFAVALLAMFAPIYLSHRRGESGWPWVAAALLLGPLSLLLYGASRYSQRKVSERTADPSS